MNKYKRNKPLGWVCSTRPRTHPGALFLKVTLGLDVSNVDQVKGRPRCFYDSSGRFYGKGFTSTVHFSGPYSAQSVRDSSEFNKEIYHK